MMSSPNHAPPIELSLGEPIGSASPSTTDTVRTHVTTDPTFESSPSSSPAATSTTAAASPVPSSPSKRSGFPSSALTANNGVTPDDGDPNISRPMNLKPIAAGAPQPLNGAGVVGQPTNSATTVVPENQAVATTAAKTTEPPVNTAPVSHNVNPTALDTGTVQFSQEDAIQQYGEKTVHAIRPPYMHRTSSVPQAVVSQPSESIDDRNSSSATGVHPQAPSATVHVPHTGSQPGLDTDESKVIPAANADLAPDHALPTAPDVHPENQKEAIENGDVHPETLAREVEKAKGDKREIMGKAPKGTIVEGMEDDQVYTLLRRFDIQVTHTLLMETTNTHPNEPDLRRSTLPDVPFNSDVLKANLERLYAVGGIGAIRAVKEMNRLRSWAPEERKRTIYFCATYFFCWIFGYSIPALLLFFAILIVSPESRWFFFPPVVPPAGTPPSATDPTNQAGDQSLLGDVDQPVQHRSKAEQKEEQAWEFRQLAQAFAVRVAVSDGDKKKQGNATMGEKVHESDLDSSDSEDESDEFLDAELYAEGEHPAEIERQQRAIQNGPAVKRSAVPAKSKVKPDSQGLNGRTETVKDKNGNEIEKPMSDKKRKRMQAKEAKAKRDQIVGHYTKLTQDGLGDMADLIECLANALSPPPPYPPNTARYKIAGAIFVPLILATAFVPAWIWHRASSFSLGFAFFGQPLIDRGIEFFITHVPNWQELLDLRNSLLSGVPTNDQLTIHLLRVGERANHPLPRAPPPPLAGTPKEQIKDTAPNPDDELEDEDGNPMDPEDLSGKDKAVHKTRTKFVNTFKSLSKKAATFHADVTVNGAKKKVGTTLDKALWGTYLKDNGDISSYVCKLNGIKGHVVINPMDVGDFGARVRFEPSGGIGDQAPLFDRSINDIVEVKKAGISVPRAVLGWASGADIDSQTLYVRMKTAAERINSKNAKEGNVKGLEAQEGDIYEFQAVQRREQLFDRLISMGNQRWETL